MYNTFRGARLLCQSWFTAPPATTTQVYPFQWYVVAKGQTFNLPSSSATYGPIFWALRNISIIL